MIILENIMDPSSLSNLDPKLRETYERVMSTSTPTPVQTPADSGLDQSNKQVEPQPIINNPPIDTQAEALNTQSAAQNPYSQEPHPETVTISQNPPTPNTFNQPVKPHAHSSLIKVFYFLGAAVFFLVYIFFWVKILNVKLPF